MKLYRALILSVFGVIAIPVCARPQATRPATSATQPAADDTPQAMLLHQCDVLLSGDVDAALKFCYMTNDTERHYSYLGTQTNIEVVKAEQIIGKRFGKETSEKFLRALGHHPREEVELATVTIEGDTALWAWKGEASPSFALRRVDGRWKFDMHIMVFGMSSQAIGNAEQRMNAQRLALEQMIHDLNEGALHDAGEVIAKTLEIANSF